MKRTNLDQFTTTEGTRRACSDAFGARCSRIAILRRRINPPASLYRYLGAAKSPHRVGHAAGNLNAEVALTWGDTETSPDRPNKRVGHKLSLSPQPPSHERLDARVRPPRRRLIVIEVGTDPAAVSSVAHAEVDEVGADGAGKPADRRARARQDSRGRRKMRRPESPRTPRMSSGALSTRSSHAASTLGAAARDQRPPPRPLDQ